MNTSVIGRDHGREASYHKRLLWRLLFLAVRLTKSKVYHNNESFFFSLQFSCMVTISTLFLAHNASPPIYSVYQFFSSVRLLRWRFYSPAAWHVTLCTYNAFFNSLLLLDRPMEGRPHASRVCFDSGRPSHRPRSSPRQTRASLRV